MQPATISFIPARYGAGYAVSPLVYPDRGNFYLANSAGNSYGVRSWPAALPMQQNSQTIEAEQYKNTGNEFRKRGMMEQARQAYETAIRVAPGYTAAYFNLAQLEALTGRMPRAVDLLSRLLAIDPMDHTARLTLGEYYERTGFTQEAKKRYLEILQVQPHFDPAKRKLDYLLYRDQVRFYPDTADELLATRYREIMTKSKALLIEFFTVHQPNPVYRKLIQDLTIVFEPTQKTGDTDNMAEFDPRRGVTRLLPEMLFSSPNVVAAYLAHETVHAMDGDGHTSVLEEQDAYRHLARFWAVYKGQEVEPNLDRAVELYRQSMDALDQEVRRIYTIQSPGIADKSPGHGLPSPNARHQSAAAYDIQYAIQAQERLKYPAGAMGQS